MSISIFLEFWPLFPSIIELLVKKHVLQIIKNVDFSYSSIFWKNFQQMQQVCSFFYVEDRVFLCFFQCFVNELGSISNIFIFENSKFLKNYHFLTKNMKIFGFCPSLWLFSKIRLFWVLGLISFDYRIISQKTCTIDHKKCRFFVF